MGTQQRLWSVEERQVDSTKPVIHYGCRKPAHLAAASRGGRGDLTVYRGGWAYCDAHVEDHDHLWVETGGVPFDRLVDWTKALDPLRAVTVRARR